MTGEAAPIGLDQARAALREAGLLQGEIARFQSRWERRPLTGFTPLPIWSWEQFERQLLHLSGRPEVAETVRLALSGWRARAWMLPPEMLLRELLIISSVAMDETFEPMPMREPEAEDGPLHGEASMP